MSREAYYRQHHDHDADEAAEVLSSLAGEHEQVTP